MTAVAWMGMVSAVWRHAIEGSVATIRDEIELIRDDLPPESLSLIENRLLRVQQLSQQVLERPITPPLADNEGVESINLSDFVQERIGQLRENEAFQQIEINLIPRLAEAYTVRASRAWLRQIFDIIVDNAAIALTNSPLPRLIIIVKQTGTQAEIIIHDTGPGIPADIQKKIFNQQIEKPQGSQGLGMGLLMAKTVAQAYGGDLNIKVSNKNGTSVVISFPIETPISASSGPAVERSMGTSDRPAARSIDLSEFTSA
jgi:signal transduction histidine kinase